MDYMNILCICFSKKKGLMSYVVIFGLNDFAQLAYYYISHEKIHNVVGFTVHREYLNTETYQGLPVVAFDTIEQSFPTRTTKLFAPLGPRNMNSLREIVFIESKKKGYEFISYVSPMACTYNSIIGENCFIFENNIIQPYSVIGDNNIIWSGNHIGHHSEIRNHCFISSHVVISGHVLVENNCFLGVNSTLVDGIKLASNTYVGAGAIIVDDTIFGGVYPGHKSQISRVPSNRLRWT